MCAKNHLLIFSSFLDIWGNVEWPLFLDHPVCYACDCVLADKFIKVKFIAYLRIMKLAKAGTEQPSCGL